jgi:hypothetical protein
MDAITGSMSSSPCKVKVAGIRTTENTAPIIKILLTKGHRLHDIVPRMAVHMDTQHSIPWASWDAVFDIYLDAVTKDVFSSQPYRVPCIPCHANLTNSDVEHPDACTRHALALQGVLSAESGPVEADHVVDHLIDELQGGRKESATHVACNDIGCQLIASRD